TVSAKARGDDRGRIGAVPQWGRGGRRELPTRRGNSAELFPAELYPRSCALEYSVQASPNPRVECFEPFVGSSSVTLMGGMIETIVRGGYGSLHFGACHGKLLSGPTTS